MKHLKKHCIVPFIIFNCDLPQGQSKDEQFGNSINFHGSFYETPGLFSIITEVTITSHKVFPLYKCICLFFCSRLCLPAVPGRDFSPGPDWCLHWGGWKAVPVCIQPHHQRQTSEWHNFLQWQKRSSLCSFLTSTNLFRNLRAEGEELVSCVCEILLSNYNVFPELGLKMLVC